MPGTMGGFQRADGAPPLRDRATTWTVTSDRLGHRGSAPLIGATARVPIRGCRIPGNEPQQLRAALRAGVARDRPVRPRSRISPDSTRLNTPHSPVRATVDRPHPNTASPTRIPGGPVGPTLVTNRLGSIRPRVRSRTSRSLPIRHNLTHRGRFRRAMGRAIVRRDWVAASRPVRQFPRRFAGAREGRSCPP